MNNERNLSSLHPTEEGRVVRLSLNGGMRRRLLDIGIVPGTHIRCVGISPLGDPLAFLVRGRKIAIRKRDSAGIIIE